MHAVLMLCVSLVQGVATTLGMGRIHRTRECHTTPMPASLPQAKPDTQSDKETNSTHGVIVGPVPIISVGAATGLSIDPPRNKQPGFPAQGRE
jgi:hypothetical protein